MIIRIACIALISAPVFCMDNTPAVVCGIAQEKDLPGILALYEKAAINENDKEKIVILPLQVREEKTRDAIAKKRLFVAKINGVVVGFKKNYIVTDPSELQEILTQEFRFTENKTVSRRSVCVEKNIFSNTDFADTPYHFASAPTYIYTGADFTDPEYRGKGINTQLSLKALALVMENIKADTMKLVFGLAEHNAESAPEKDYIDRVPGIAKIFARVIQESYKTDAPITFSHYKTRAYMPQFTYENGKLIISSDATSIPGFGNILAYRHTKENHD